MREYLMIMHELGKARLAERARKRHDIEEPFPRKRPRSRAGASAGEPGGDDVPSDVNKLRIGPQEGMRPSVLDI
jgi:hypothetical protein